MLWIALLAMATACLMQHLGLSQAIASVITKVAKCPKCMTFWITFFVLLLMEGKPFASMVLSILMSYLSHYFGLFLMALNKIYDWLWQRVNK